MKVGFRDQLKKSFEPIPELEEQANEEEFETEEVSVKIVELSTTELAKSNNWIGQNRPKYSDDEQDASSGNDEPMEPVEEIPGMGLVVKAIGKQRKPKLADSECTESKPNIAADILKNKIIKSKRDLGKVVQKDALRTLKNSKAFQQKQKLDKLADRKKARQERGRRIKVQNKEAKKHGGRVNQRKIKKKMKLRQKGKR